MRRLLACLIVAAVQPCTSLAQPMADPAASAPAAAVADNLTDGEVRKVDGAAKKLTIRHGPIRNLDMPPMTMVFQVRDAAQLDQLKPGDRIRFAVEQTATGLQITEIRRGP